MRKLAKLVGGALMAFTAAGALAQNTSVQLFPPVVIQTSPNNTLKSFGTKTMVLSCPVTGLSAVVSQSATANMPIFGDNFIGLTLNPPTGQTVPTNQVNICTDSTGNPDVQGQGSASQYAGTYDCFKLSYSNAGVAGSYLNMNPDNATSSFGTLLTNYAVTPPDISTALSANLLFPDTSISESLSRGTVTAQFDLMDFGGSFGSSSLYLRSNCAQTSGEPVIVNINPFGNTGFDVATFSSGGHTYTYKIGNYPANGGATVAITDLQLSQAEFQALLTATPGGTNFPNAQCIPYASASNQCEVFNVECVNSTDATTCSQLVYDVLTTYDLANASQSILAPGFLKFSSETGKVENIFTQFTQTRIDPTTGGRTTGFSKFVAVDLGGYASSGTCNGDLAHQVLQPINADGTSLFNGGRTVPVKFRVCDSAGNSVSTPGTVTNLRLIKTKAGTVTTVLDDGTVSTTPDTSFRWDSTGQQWIYNLSTKGMATNTTYYYRITLSNGSFIDFSFGLK